MYILLPKNQIGGIPAAARDFPSFCFPPASGKLALARLTKRTIDALKPLEKRDVFAWDSEIMGLGLRLKPSGVKSFFVQYRNSANRTRRMVIGQYGVLTVEQARNQAREHLSGVTRGEDPSADRKSARAVFTVAELCKW